MAVRIALEVQVPQARRLLDALRPNSARPTAIHLVARNVCAAMHHAAAIFPRFTHAPIFAEQLAVLQSDLALVPASRTGRGVNHMNGQMDEFPEWSLWAIDGLGAQPGVERLLASVAFLVARGDTITSEDLKVLRRALEDAVERGKRFDATDAAHGAAFGRAVARLERRIAQVSHLGDTAAWALVERGDDDEDLDAFRVNDDFIVEERARGKAKRLAKSMGSILRRQFCPSTTWALSGGQARALAGSLQTRIAQAPTAANLLAMLCLVTGRPVGTLALGAELGDVVPSMPCVREGALVVDLDRGLYAFRVVGCDAFFDIPEDPSLATLFVPAHQNVVLPLPPALLAALRERTGSRLMGRVFADDEGTLAGEFATLIAELSKELGWRVSATRIARALAVAVFAVSGDLPMAQRLCGDALGLGTAAQHYICVEMASHAQCYADALVHLGVMDHRAALAALPPDWAGAYCGARRLPTPEAMQCLAAALDALVKPLYRMEAAVRRASSATPLAVTTAALLMLGSSHRWTGAIGRLALDDVNLSLGLAVLADKATNGPRLAGLPPIVATALREWLDYLTWARTSTDASLAARAQAALGGRAPLLFCHGPEAGCSDLQLAEIAGLLGPIASEVLKGARCFLSSRLREHGIRATVIEAQLGRLLFGLQPFDAANMLAPAEFYAPALTAIDDLLRSNGFRAPTGVPDRLGIRFAPDPGLAPWDEAITRLQKDLACAATAEAAAFDAQVRERLPAIQRRADQIFATFDAGTSVDRVAVRRVFDELRSGEPRTPQAVVACARAVAAASKVTRRRGVQVAPLAHYVPRFSTPPIVTIGQMRAVASQAQFQAWLLDPAAWPNHAATKEGYKRLRVARFALGLLHFGVVRSLADARCVILALPQAERWPCLPACLAVAVRWDSDKPGTLPATAMLGGALSYLAIGALPLDGASVTAVALESWCASALARAPWPQAPLGTMVTGIVTTAGLAGSVTLPGPLAALARAEITPRDLPPDLMRAVFEGTAPEPAKYPALAGSAATSAVRCAHDEVEKSATGSFLVGLYRELPVAIQRDDPGHVRDWSRRSACTDTQLLLGEVAARLVWLPGERVDSYAARSQSTFLSLVARPLLARLGDKKLGTVPKAEMEAALIGIWEAGDVDPRRAVGLSLIAEVLDDLFGVDDLDLDEIRGVVQDRPPRALVIAPTLWAQRNERLDALCARYPDGPTRAALGDLAAGLDLQFPLAFRTNALAGVRGRDVFVSGEEVSVRAAPYGTHTVKSVAGDHRGFVAPRSLGGGWITRWKEHARASATLQDSGLFGVVAGLDRNELLRAMVADPRVRPHDMRSTKAVAFVVEQVFDVPGAGATTLRSPAGTPSLWALSGDLGHSHPRVTCQSYVHVFSPWRALLLADAADSLTMPAIASMLGCRLLQAEEVRRRAGGGKRQHGSLLPFAAATLQKYQFGLAPVPPVPDALAVLGSVDFGFEKRWQALRDLHAGHVPIAVARAIGVPLSALRESVREVVRLEHLIGLRVLPDDVAAELLPPAELAQRCSLPTSPLRYSRRLLTPRPPRDNHERGLWLALLRAQRGRLGRLRNLCPADVFALLGENGFVAGSAWRIRIPNVPIASTPAPPSVLEVQQLASRVGASVVTDRPRSSYPSPPRFGADLVRAKGRPLAREVATSLLLSLAADAAS